MCIDCFTFISLFVCLLVCLLVVVVVVIAIMPSPLFPGNSACLRRRFDALNAKVKLHHRLVDEGVSRREEFDSCLASFAGPLSELEAKCEGLNLSGESQPLKVQEKVETVRVSSIRIVVHLYVHP